MVFSEFVNITVESAFDFLFFPEDVRIVTRFLNMLGYRLNIRHLEQFLEALPFHEFAKPFAVLSFFHPIVPDAFNDFFDLVVRLFNLDKRNQE